MMHVVGFQSRPRPGFIYINGGLSRAPRIGYLLAGLSGLVVLLAIVGAIYQSVESSNDVRTHSPPGSLIDVSGYKMHLYCVGDGSPAVILESGLNDSWLSWYKVQPSVATFTRVCSYDRASVGWSDVRPEPPDSRNIALHLHSPLQNAGVKPPYVLTGHSIGGIHVRVYQNMYPSDVVGMVLVDSSHPDQTKRSPPQLLRTVFRNIYISSLAALFKTCFKYVPGETNEVQNIAGLATVDEGVIGRIQGVGTVDTYPRSMAAVGFPVSDAENQFRINFEGERSGWRDYDVTIAAHFHARVNGIERVKIEYSQAYTDDAESAGADIRHCGMRTTIVISVFE